MGCSGLKSRNFTSQWARNYPTIFPEDYKRTLIYLGQDFFSNPENRVAELNPKSSQYLLSLYEEITSKNDDILNDKERPTFFFVEHQKPFIFSLPGARFYFSSTLLKKYVSNESLLVAMLSFEILKSSRVYYKKSLIYPTGSVNLEQMISYVKIPVESKIELNKWTYRMIQKTSYDATACLNWLQIQNRNALAFSFQINDLKEITQEEYSFKSFLAQKGFFSEGAFLKKINVNSSKNFYRFINYIRKEGAR